MVWGGYLENSDSRVVVMEVRRICICEGRVPGVEMTAGGGAFSLLVCWEESTLFWLDASSFLGCVGGDEGIWEEESCEEGGVGIGNSSCTI